MTKKDNLLFSIETAVFFHAVKAIKEVASLDELSRVVLRIVDNAAIFSCVGKGMFLNYAVPIESFSKGTFLLDVKDLALSVGGLLMNQEAQRREVARFYFNKRRGGNRIIMKVFSTHGEKLKILQTKVLSLRSLDTAPSVPAMPKDGRVSILSEEMITPIQSVLQAASQTSSNPAFCGCNVSLKDSAITSMAMDGICLSEYSNSIEASGEFECLLPYGYCSKIPKLVPEESSLEVLLSNGLFFIKSSVCVFGTVVIGTSLPDCSQILSEKKPIGVTFDKDVFIECLNMFPVVVSKDIYARITIVFDTTTETMSIFSKGFSSSGIPAKFKCPPTFSGCSVDFNLNYLRRSIRPIRSDSVLLSISDPQKPIFIQPNDENQKHLCVMAPLTRGTVD